MYNINIISGLDDEKILYIKELNNYIIITKSELQNGEYEIGTEELLNIIHQNCEDEYEKFRRIIQNRDRNLAFCDKNIRYSHYSLCLHPSRKCNLSCEYCFADGQEYLPQCGLSIDVVRKAIDFLIYDIGKESSKYSIDLSGSGEPLLEFELIKQIEDYCEKKRNETGKDIKIMFPTNATLMDKEKAEYFESKPNILLGVSIDGDKKGNSNRLFKNKSGTYEAVCRGINLLENRKVGLAVTITHNNEAVDEVFDHLYNFKNVDAISMQFVRDFDKLSETSFYNIDQINLIKHYQLLIDKIIEHINDGDYNYLFTLLRGVDTFGTYIVRVSQKGVLNRFRCGGAKNRFALDEKGNLFSCAVMSGHDYFKLGDIYNGIDIKQQGKHLKINACESESCSKCWCAYICSGECPVAAYLTNGNLYEPNEEICKIRRELVKLSIGFVQKLKKDNYEAYKMLCEFSVNKSNYEESDSGIWAIQNYLKSRDIDISYSKLTELVKRTDKGVHPIEIKRFINQYDREVNAFQIDEVDAYDNIQYPAIVINTNQHFFRYNIVEGVDGECLKVRSLEDIQTVNVSKDSFNKKSIIFLSKSIN